MNNLACVLPPRQLATLLQFSHAQCTPTCPHSLSQVLLPTSSFMSPAEARGGTNTGRVRMFERDKLSAPALGRAWDCARIVCTQPFCRTAAYGLAFVRFRSAEAPPTPQQPQTQQQTVRLGAFTLKPETEDTIRTGGLFNRRSELTAAAAAASSGEVAATQHGL